jgi:hypothetical protein
MNLVIRFLSTPLLMLCSVTWDGHAKTQTGTISDFRLFLFFELRMGLDLRLFEFSMMKIGKQADFRD